MYLITLDRARLVSVGECLFYCSPENVHKFIVCFCVLSKGKNWQKKVAAIPAQKWSDSDAVSLAKNGLGRMLKPATRLCGGQPYGDFVSTSNNDPEIE